MKIEECTNHKEAIESFTREGQNYVFVRHTLEPGEEIRLHYHKKANEWIVIDNGIFTVRMGEEERTFNLKNETVAVRFPKGQKHSLLARSKISYFVFRDQEDETIYYKET